MDKLLHGAAAGLIATVPMTIVMRSLHRLLPEREKYPLPPQRITSRVANAAGVASAAPARHEWEWKTHAAHYAYGTGCGVAYAAVADRLPGPPMARGALFGVGVWTASYLAWLPAAGLHRSVTREPAGRNGLMLLAHVVWGAAAGAAYARRAGRDAAGSYVTGRPNPN